MELWNYEILADPAAVSRRAAEIFVEAARESIAAQGFFCVALAGGSTPKSMYQLLAAENEPFRAAVSWEKVFFFWGDERHVAPESVESNFRMANEALLQPLKIAASNIFRIQSELAAETAAENYAQTIRDFFKLEADEFPRFDLILLGMGADGHTASLFPNTAVLHETKHIVAAPFVEKFNSFRLTLTPPVLNAAAKVVFLVVGAEKSYALNEILHGAKNPDRFPAQIINPENGQIIWLTDEAAQAVSGEQ